MGVGVASDNGHRNRPRRVYVVDDHETVRDGFKWIFRHLEDLEVCGEAGDAGTALKGISQTNPDIVVVDVVLPLSSGIELIKDIRARYPHLPILAYTGHDPQLYGERSLKAGANGFMTKPASGKELLVAIRKLLAREPFLVDSLRYSQLALLTKSLSRCWREDLLTDRELQIFDFIGRGRNVQEIADALNLSADTVRTHRENIRKKLGFRDSTELAQHALRWVLMRAEPNGYGIDNGSPSQTPGNLPL
jgi:DNA-binding NarL/FixJ family response regulator